MPDGSSIISTGLPDPSKFIKDVTAKPKTPVIGSSRFGVIVSYQVGVGATVRWEGESVNDNQIYMFSSAYTPIIGDRVWCTYTGWTWIINGRIGAYPDVQKCYLESNFTIPNQTSPKVALTGFSASLEANTKYTWIMCVYPNVTSGQDFGWNWTVPSGAIHIEQTDAKPIGSSTPYDTVYRYALPMTSDKSQGTDASNSGTPIVDHGAILTVGTAGTMQLMVSLASAALGQTRDIQAGSWLWVCRMAT